MGQNEKLKAYNEMMLDNQIDQALSLIEEMIAQNPEDHMNYVTKHRLLVYMGLTQKADLYFLKELGHFIQMEEDIISNWLEVEWVPELLKYLPPENDVSKTITCLCQYARHSAAGNQKAKIQEIDKLMKVTESDDIDYDMLCCIGYLMINSRDETYPVVVPIMSRFNKLIDQKLRGQELDNEERAYYQRLKENFAVYFTHPEHMMMKAIGVDDKSAEALYIKEDFWTLAIIPLMVAKSVEERVDKLEREFSVKLLRCFGKIRNDQISLSLTKQLMDFCDKYRCQRPDQNRAFSKMLLMIIYVECAIYSEEEDKAMDYLLETKYEISDAFGEYSYDVIRYGQPIMAFYEAWIKKDLEEIEALLPEIESTKIKWLNDLVQNIVAKLRKLESSKDNYQASHIEAMLKQIEQSMSSIEIKELSKLGMAEELQRLLKEMPKKEIRIAVTGETSAGKSTFLNRLFNTELFFTTQEEATGVPTEIRKGENITVEVFNHKGELRSAYQTAEGTWIDKDKEEYLKERIELERKREEDYNKRLKKYNSLWNKLLRWCGKEQEEVTRETDEIMTPEAFILKHSKVGEEALEWIDKVCVTLPVENMPDNIVIIDTPGFNANPKRADIAKKVIEESHVGMFVIDARNAMKKEEMKVAKYIQSEVSKMIFIVNKVDNIEVDDELDCDDEDSIEDRVAYMKNKISEELGSKTVEIWPVCSLPKSEVKEESKKYCDNIQTINQMVIEAIQRQRIELVVDQAAKQVEILISQVGQYADEMITKLTKEVAQLEENKYIDPEFLRDDILERGSQLYIEEVNNYVVKIQRHISRHLNSAQMRFNDWLKTVQTKDELREYVNRKVAYNIQEAIGSIERNRKAELENLSETMQNYLQDVFKQLYDKLDISLNNRRKFNGTTVHLNHDRLSTGRFSANQLNESISRAQSTADGLLSFVSSDTRKMVGSGIAGVYKFTDKLLGKSLQQLVQETDVQFSEKLSSVEKEICDVFSKDLDQEEQSSYMNRLQDYIEEEIEAYEQKIQEKILEVKNRWIRENKNIMLLEKEIHYMQVKMNQINKWRQIRKAN